MERREKIETALRSFGKNRDLSRDAYSILYEDGFQVVRTYLRYRRASAEDADEIGQNIFIRVWDNWHRLQFNGVAQWYAYLYTSARNALHDLALQPQPEPAEDNVTDPQPSPEAVIEDSLARQRFYNLADEVWLGVPPAESTAKRLVAKYLYVDGKPCAEVLKFASRSSAETRPDTCEDLRKWLSNVWVIRRTAFDSLYVAGDQLAAHLLGLGRVDVRELNALGEAARSHSPHEPAIGSWRWGDVLVILLRFRHGMPFSQVMRRLPDSMPESQVFEVSARCTRSFPFVSTMATIWERLNSDPLRERALKQNSLWKRLAFQYHFAHELAQDDIVERISPPAAVTGYVVNYINTWIAGRLADELAKHLDRAGGDRR